jgi:hypothetical protein
LEPGERVVLELAEEADVFSLWVFRVGRLARHTDACNRI